MKENTPRVKRSKKGRLKLPRKTWMITVLFTFPALLTLTSTKKKREFACYLEWESTCISYIDNLGPNWIHIPWFFQVIIYAAYHQGELCRYSHHNKVSLTLLKHEFIMLSPHICTLYNITYSWTVLCKSNLHNFNHILTLLIPT